MQTNILKRGELEPDTILYRLYEDGSVRIDYRPQPHLSFHRLFLTATQYQKLVRAHTHAAGRIHAVEPVPGSRSLPDVTR
jgi:hypothetical protein